MSKKKKKSFTKEQLRRFMEGESAYEAMGGTKSPNAGKQQFMSQEVEKLLRKNPEIFEGSFRSGGEVRAADVRDNPKRGKCY